MTIPVYSAQRGRGLGAVLGGIGRLALPFLKPVISKVGRKVLMSGAEAIADRFLPKSNPTPFDKVKTVVARRRAAKRRRPPPKRVVRTKGPQKRRRKRKRDALS